MKQEEKQDIVKEAIKSIAFAGQMIDIDIFTLDKRIQGLLIECYKLGFIKGFETKKI